MFDRLRIARPHALVIAAGFGTAISLSHDTRRNPSCGSGASRLEKGYERTESGPLSARSFFAFNCRIVFSQDD